MRGGGTQRVLAAGPVAVNRPRRPPQHRHLHGSDFIWAIAFVVPYAAVFFAFAVYPIGYALWMASKPSLYADLITDPLYLPTVVNTLLFVGLGHWMLIGEQGLVDGVLSALFGIDGPLWFNNRWLGLGSNIIAYIWKWMPFWTLIFLAARMRIPQDIYDSAEIDGATGSRRFVHVTFPLLANLYLLCTLLSALWTVGDFTTVYLVSGGGPAGSTEVLATLGFRYAFDFAKPALGVAAVMSALPVLIPIVIVLIRRLQTSEVQM